jgi:hypothetical protein
MMASIRIGRKLIVCDGEIPNNCRSQPHWKTATSAPNAANADSRNPASDLIGTRMVRNASVRRARPRSRG